MARFDAATAVEDLEWDFTKYGGGQGVINEPSTGKVQDFFTNMKGMVKEVKALAASAEELENIENLDDEGLAEKVGQMDEAEAGAKQFQAKSIQHIATLCGDSPSVKDLETLPYRVLQAFTQWLMGEIRPNPNRPAGKR